MHTQTSGQLKLGQTWPFVSHEVGPCSATIALPELAIIRADLGQIRTEIDQIGPTSTKIGQNLARNRPSLAKFRPYFAAIGPVSAPDGRPMPAHAARDTRRETPQGCAPNSPPDAATGRLPRPHWPSPLLSARKIYLLRRWMLANRGRRPQPTRHAWPRARATHESRDNSAPNVGPACHERMPVEPGLTWKLDVAPHGVVKGSA